MNAACALVILFPLHSPAPALDATPVGEAHSSAHWGMQGHLMAARAAHQALPGVMPAFFLEAGAQMQWLNYEPDRWRDERAAAMNEGFRYDHYVDLENVPTGALEARDRWRFLSVLVEAGVELPHRDVGFAFYRSLELYDRVRNGFERWRSETDPQVRGWIEQRIVNDAGILGHYVTDLSNPHHATVHFNGWDESIEPNPGGFTTDRGFHARFESRFVEQHVQFGDVLVHLAPDVRTVDPRSAVLNLLLDSNAQVGTLYELDRDVGFEPGLPAHPEAHRFAAERIAAGATLLRDLWWTAWVTSGDGPAAGG